MLGTLIKALEVDLRNVDNDRYVRSNTNISQNLSRILAIRKHYPEFKAKGMMMFPKLAELGRLSKKEGLCLSYWHESGDVSAFNAALRDKSGFEETTLHSLRPAKFKNALLNRFLQQSGDTILMNYLGDLSKTTSGVGERQREHRTQGHKQQVTGLRYHLHVLEEQLQSMIAKRSANLDFSPMRKASLQNSVLPISFDNGPVRIANANQFAKHAPSFDTTGPIDIWYGLAEDPRTPYRFLVWLSENHNPYVSQRALTTLKRQQQQIENRSNHAAYAS